MIPTLFGELAPSELGLTLVHEHLLNRAGSLVGDLDANLDHNALLQREVGAAMEGGLRTIVEVSSFEMQRDVPGIRHLARDLGLNVILSTGFFFGPYVPEAVRRFSVEKLSQRLLDDLHGANCWGVTAGVIGEIGCSEDGLTPWEQRIHQAAANAHRETRCSIVTHTCNGSQAVQQAQYLIDKGARPAAILICHVDADRPLGDYLAVLGTGAYVSMDRVGDSRRCDDAARAQRLMELIERGHINRLLLSHDLARNSRLSANGGHGYAHITSSFLPRLRGLGLDERSIDQLMVHNPARFLDWSLEAGA